MAIRCRRPLARCCVTLCTLPISCGVCPLVTAAGFRVQSFEPHGYIQTSTPDYLLSLLSRGTSASARAGEIGQELVDAFDQEARRRIANGTFYGAILFLSLAARKIGK